jgi:zinc/manganese transport system substrate-binding protein
MGTALLSVLLVAASATRIEDKIRILTTTPELRDIVTQVGGDLVEATSLLKGPEDPHFVDAKPSFIKEANRADLFVKMGMSLEIGYEPLIVTDSRNPKIQPGTPGYVDASASIRKLEVPQGVVDRSQGDVHPEGNPHYLLDPMNGKVVAATLRDALIRIAPREKAAFEEKTKAFARAVDEAMFGAKLLERFSADALAEPLSAGTLLPFLRERHLEDSLGGFAAEMAPLAGSPIVTYHGGALSYFANRFHLERVAALEPKPGIPPSSAHLASVIETIKARSVRVVFFATYNPRKPVDKVCEETGAKPALFPHQVNALPGATSYLKQMEMLVKLATTELARP